MKDNSIMKLGGPDGGEVESDETFVGARGVNMHKDKKLRLQQLVGEKAREHVSGKTAVMGLLDRDLRQVWLPR